MSLRILSSSQLRTQHFQKANFFHVPHGHIHHDIVRLWDKTLRYRVRWLRRNCLKQPDALSAMLCCAMLSHLGTHKSGLQSIRKYLKAMTEEKFEALLLLEEYVDGMCQPLFQFAILPEFYHIALRSYDHRNLDPQQRRQGSLVSLIRLKLPSKTPISFSSTQNATHQRYALRFPWFYLKQLPPETFLPAMKPFFQNHHLLKDLLLHHCLSSCDTKTLEMFLPWLVHGLRSDAGLVVSGFIERMVTANITLLVPVQLQLSVEVIGIENTSHDSKARALRANHVLVSLSEKLRHLGEKLSSLAPDVYGFTQQLAYYTSVLRLSHQLAQLRRNSAQGYASQEGLTKKLVYEPSLKVKPFPWLPDSSLVVKKPLVETLKIMKSAENAPVCLSFALTSQEDCQQHDCRGLIFKSNDNMQQDQLVLRLIQLFDRLFKKLNLPLLFCHYKVFPCKFTSNCENISGGLIEVIPNALSRHQIGRMNKCSLSAYYRQQYSDEVSFQLAQWAFLRSLAAYSLTSFLLQIKDRHNGNIMITSQGAIVHIDFGFVFDVSPGNDLKFEKAAFKLTSEMIELLGGSSASPLFAVYETLMIQGFLTLRQDAHSILSVVAGMLDAALPCMKHATLRRLRKRLCLGKTATEAAAFLHEHIMASYNALTTRLYDVVQSFQQGIEH